MVPPTRINQRRQGIFWLLTIPHNEYTPYLPPQCSYSVGQLEEGAQTGYRHWQICVAFKEKQGLNGVKAVFGTNCHAELSRSSAAADYCQKEETAISNTKFEFGAKPIQRNSKTDWESVWTAAKSGDFDKVLFVKNY